MGSQERIRVLHVVTNHSLGGATVVAMLLAERLDPARYEVMLAAGDSHGSEGTLLPEMRDKGLNVRLLPTLCRLPHPTRDLRAICDLRAVIREFRPQIIHTHGSKPKLLVPLATRFAPVPVKVANIHGWDWQPVRSPLLRCLLKVGARAEISSYDVIVATSRWLMEVGLANHVGRPQQYVVNLPGVDLEAFNTDDKARVRSEVRAGLRLDAGDFVLVSVMRLTPQKAPLDLVAALGLAVQTDARIRLVVIGGGEMAEQVQEDVRRRGLEEQVRLVGARRDVPRFMKAADAFVMASLWEPLGIVYMEAAACGLPSIGTRTGGVPEIVEDGATGMLTPIGDPDAMASAILRLAGDPELHMRMGAAALGRAPEFTRDRCVARFDEIYQRSLAAKGLV